MKLSFEIIENSAAIQKNILNALLGPAKKYMDDAIKTIKDSLPVIINNAIINTPEYSSLLGGRLKYEFGIPDSNSKLSGLLDIWSRNIVLDYKPPIISASAIKSSFSASMIRIDFQDVLYTDFAQMQDSLRGYSLPWLQWLLLEGDKTIIQEHDVVIGSSRFSRTGNAVMKKSVGKSWKVPSEFSGTSSDNWITRAIDSVANDIDELLQEAMKI